MRKMLTKDEIDRDGIDRLLNAIDDLGVKSGAFLDVVACLEPADRHYLSHGSIARLKQMPDAKQRGVGAQINAFLDAHPVTRGALGLP